MAVAWYGCSTAWMQRQDGLGDVRGDRRGLDNWLNLDKRVDTSSIEAYMEEETGARQPSMPQRDGL